MEGLWGLGIRVMGFRGHGLGLGFMAEVGSGILGLGFRDYMGAFWGFWVFR